MQASNFTIGVTTYNRKDILLKCLPTFRRLNPLHDFLICDDASTEMSESFLKELFSGWRVYRSIENSGRADYAMARLMDLFLATGKDYLVILDSDLLIDPDLSEFICNKAALTDGVFSVFNTPSHRVTSEEGDWLIKDHIGAAGAVIKRSLVQEIREKVKVTNRFDWDWSEYLKKTNRKIIVIKMLQIVEKNYHKSKHDAHIS